MKIDLLRAFAFAIPVLLLSACGADYNSAAPQRVLTTVNVSLAQAVEIGQLDTATVVLLDQYGAPLSAGTVTWTSSRPEVAGVSPTTGVILAISPGTAQISASVDGKTGQRTITVFKSPIRLNEIRSAGELPAGWIELFNPTEAPIDISGWRVTNANVLQGFVLPEGVIIPAFGFVAVNETLLAGGLGTADAVHLFSRFGVQVDAFSWTADVATSFGRCPDGTAAFVTTTEPTRRAANACPTP